jgi:outer membrane lipoprotein-sorting protein
MVTHKSSVAVLVVGMIAMSGCLGAVTGSDSADASADAPTDAIQETGNETQEADNHTARNDSQGADDGEPSGEEVVERFEQRMESLESFVAVQRTSATYDDNEINTTSQLWVRLDTGEYRQETIAPEENAGTVSVVNRSVMATYSPQNNEYTVFPNQSADPEQPMTTMEFVLQDAELSYEDTVRLDGERTHRLAAAPNESAGFDTNVTLWVDAETYFPSRIELSFSDEVNATTVVEYEDAILNWSIPNSTFALDPPEDAERSEFTSPNLTTFDAREDLVANASMTVPDPDLPANFTFESATLTEGETRNVRVVYSNGSAEITVNKINDTQAMPSDGETVQIGDREGRYQSFANDGMVVWTCEGNTYSVIGPASEERLTTIAESMVCD